MPTRSTFANAVIGGVVAIVLFFIPFSPVLGGGVAGYLQGRDGLRVGAMAGALASIPAVILVSLGVAFVPTGDLLMARVALLTGMVLIAAYGIFLGAGGGAIGVLLATRVADDGSDAAGSDLVSGDGDSVGNGAGDSEVDSDDESVGEDGDEGDSVGDSGGPGHTVAGDGDRAA